MIISIKILGELIVTTPLIVEKTTNATIDAGENLDEVKNDEEKDNGTIPGVIEEGSAENETSDNGT